MFILCQGKMAENPLELPFTSNKIYSLEELCYELYHNLYTISVESFDDTLVKWLKEETEHPMLARKLQKIMEGRPKLKDIIITIFCACDYYQEEEIRTASDILDEISNLPVYKKKKMKADNYLRARRYAKSATEYIRLLRGSFAVNFTTEEYGDILHNLGIAHFYTSSMAEAEQDFQEAYARNNKRSSLEHYLWILLMRGAEQEFESETIRYKLTEEEVGEIRLQYKMAYDSCDVPESEEGDLEKYRNELIEVYEI